MAYILHNTDHDLLWYIFTGRYHGYTMVYHDQPWHIFYIIQTMVYHGI